MAFGSLGVLLYRVPKFRPKATFCSTEPSSTFAELPCSGDPLKVGPLFLNRLIFSEIRFVLVEVFFLRASEIKT